jgi:hypothetical protein
MLKQIFYVRYIGYTLQILHVLEISPVVGDLHATGTWGLLFSKDKNKCALKGVINQPSPVLFVNFLHKKDFDGVKIKEIILI